MQQPQKHHADTYFTMIIGGEEVLSYALMNWRFQISNENDMGQMPEVFNKRAPRILPENVVSLSAKRGL
jgi:hypothetical protein